MASFYPKFNTIMGKVVKYFVDKVVPQDKEILEAQARNVTIGQRDGFKLAIADAATIAFF